ncbi:MAG TPA: DUF4388 domain-containing protein [Thermoanaerobaculia bacterium]|nr:DUF4388 domain-containing protein [Thermoanaerobaculia bacterium]
MSRTFEYRGDLSATPLAEMLTTIHRYRVPGIVSVTRDKRARRLFLDEGVVLYAASNERESGLASFLNRQGVLDADSAREAYARQAREGLRMGQVLLQMGVVTPEKLNAAIAGQIRDIVLGALDWDAGEAVFEVGARRSADFLRVDIPILDVVLDGIRRTSDVRRLARRLGSAGTVLEKTSGPPLSLFDPSERALYEAVDGKTPLRELCARPPRSEADNARILYAFFCLGLLRRGRATVSGAKKIQYKTGGNLSS